jgi:branched-chain amino acid transport system substrate-binding protein
VQAWVARTNANGGLNCHPVKYIVADDGGDPSRNQALVRQLVEQDGVIAFVQMNGSITGDASQRYLTQKRIPVIGSEGAEPAFYSSPMYFPQASSGDLIWGVFFGAGDYFARAEAKPKVGVIYCVEVAQCSRAQTLGPAYAKKFGFSLVYMGSASLAQPDYTSNCQAAANAGVQIFLVSLDANSLERLARSCASVNFHPVYVTIASAASLQIASDAGLEGMGAALNTLPWFATSNPGIVEFQNALRQFAPGLRPGGASVTGWVSAKLFERASKNLSDPPTSQSILDGLWSIKDDDLGGLTYPLTFTRDQNAAPVLCYWVAQIKGGQYISPNNAQRACTAPATA